MRWLNFSSRIFIWAMMGLSLGPSPVFAHSAFDSDSGGFEMEVLPDDAPPEHVVPGSEAGANDLEMMMDGDESRFDLSDTDEGEGVFFEDAGVTDECVQKKYSEKKHFPEYFIESSRFTLGHQLSFGTRGSRDVITNYSYIRQEWEGLLYDNIFFKLDGKVALLPENDHRAEAEDKTVVVDSDLREMYLQAGFEKFSIKIGRQIVVWGKADTVAVTDVISPRDLSEFIFIKLEDSRFGQFMLSSDIYTESGDFFFFLTPLPGVDRVSDENTRYYRALPGALEYEIHRERPEALDSEFGARYGKLSGKTDFSLMAGHFFANSAVFDFSGDAVRDGSVLNKKYFEYDMIGAALSHAEESFLFKMEAAFKKNFSFQGVDDSERYIAKKADVFDAALGIEYNANDRYQMTFEISHRFVDENVSYFALSNKNSTACYYTFTKDFIHDTLQLEYIFYYHIQEKNAYNHIKLAYDLTDNTEIAMDYACFQVDDKKSALWAFRDEDRFTIEFKLFL